MSTHFTSEQNRIQKLIRSRGRAVKKLNTIYVVTMVSVEALSVHANQIKKESDNKVVVNAVDWDGRIIQHPRKRTRLVKILKATAERDLFEQSIIAAIGYFEGFLASFSKEDHWGKVTSKILENTIGMFSKDLDPDLVENYYEIKSTRNILVHSGSIIDEAYLKRSGKKARGNLGHKIQIDSAYFGKSMLTLKTMVRDCTILAKTRAVALNL